MIDKFVIPTNNLQATIHMQGREAALTELLAAIKGYSNVGQVEGEINNMLDEVKEILE